MRLSIPLSTQLYEPHMRILCEPQRKHEPPQNSIEHSEIYSRNSLVDLSTDDPIQLGSLSLSLSSPFT